MWLVNATVAWCDEMRLRGRSWWGNWRHPENSRTFSNGFKWWRLVQSDLNDSDHQFQFTDHWWKTVNSQFNQRMSNGCQLWCNAAIIWIRKDLRQGLSAYHRKMLHGLLTWAKSHVIQLWLKQCQKCEGYRRNSARNRERRALTIVQVKRSVR